MPRFSRWCVIVSVLHELGSRLRVWSGLGGGATKEEGHARRLLCLFGLFSGVKMVKSRGLFSPWTF